LGVDKDIQKKIAIKKRVTFNEENNKFEEFYRESSESDINNSIV
jgi:hypothetical protein